MTLAARPGAPAHGSAEIAALAVGTADGSGAEASTAGWRTATAGALAAADAGGHAGGTVAAALGWVDAVGVADATAEPVVLVSGDGGALAAAADADGVADVGVVATVGRCDELQLALLLQVVLAMGSVDGVGAREAAAAGVDGRADVELVPADEATPGVCDGAAGDADGT
jgi:hypothetical protein